MQTCLHKRVFRDPNHLVFDRMLTLEHGFGLQYGMQGCAGVADDA